MINPADLPDDIDLLKAIVLRQQDQNARLAKLVADFKRALFGAKSEKSDPDQYELAFEEIEAAIEVVHAERDADVALRSAKPRKSNRGHLPKHLPRVKEVIEPDNKTCTCGAERHIIGEDTSERLDIIPAQFRVIITRGLKYACRSCEAGSVQAPAKSRLIEGGMPTEATVASVIVSKYADHLPLYRQSQIYTRQGVDLDRSTLASWVGKAAYELRLVYGCLLANLKQSSKLFMDETTAPVLDPGARENEDGLRLGTGPR